MNLHEEIESKLNEQLVSEGIFGIKKNTTIKLVTVEDSDLNDLVDRTFSIVGSSTGRFTIDGKLVHSMDKNKKTGELFNRIIKKLTVSLGADQAEQKAEDSILVSFVTAEQLWNSIKDKPIDLQFTSMKMGDFITNMQTKKWG